MHAPELALFAKPCRADISTEIGTGWVIVAARVVKKAVARVEDELGCIACAIAHAIANALCQALEQQVQTSRVLVSTGELAQLPGQIAVAEVIR